MDTLQFAHPLLLAVGLVCCALLGLLLRYLRERRQAALERFAAAPLLGRLTRNVSTTRRRIKTLLILGSVFLLFAALARPQYGFTWIEVKQKGIDILFALDTSKSMLAEDTRPNRLQRARLGVMDFVATLGGDRVGLMPFAGTSYLMCPLTLDYDAFSNALASVDTSIIPMGGTNLEAVITTALEVLNNDANHKILILLTDGESLAGNAVEAARKAADSGMTIYTVGVGTPGGELIPLAGEDQQGFVQDEAGRYVTSKLDEETLAAIAEATGGLYVPLGNNGEGLETIATRRLELLPKSELAERKQKLPLERFGWPLAGALLLLVLELLLPEHRGGGRRQSRPENNEATATIRRLAAVVVLPLALTLIPARAPAETAEEAYAQGDFLKAAKLYSAALEKRPDDPTLQYNLGTTAYKNNLHDEAIAAFTKALKSDDLALQAKAYYNRGNALYQKGAESRQGDPQLTREKWQEALESYDAATTLNPDDAEAKANRAFVSHQLETLEEEIERNQQNNSSPSDSGEQQQGDSSSQGNRQQSASNQTPENRQDNTMPEKEDEGASDKQGPQSVPDNSATPEANQQHGESPDQADDQQSQPEPAPAPEAMDTEQDTVAEAPPQEDTGESERAAASQQAEAAARRSLGKMTREEAESLLNGLRNEEGELNFTLRKGLDEQVRRDW